jgi:trans-AT polyketide synthase, acyltransferase and oxidoreductase domains
MNRPTIFMLSGQGSQYFGMGKDLFEKQSAFRKWMLTLDATIKHTVGFSIISVLFDKTKKKSDLFNKTLHTHLSLFTVEYSLVKTFIELGIKPDYLLGHSLGEIIAITLSEILSIEDVVFLLSKQAELSEKYCPAGGMIAVFDNSRLYSENRLLNENSDLVSVSFDSHFIISGHKDKIKKIKTFLDLTRTLNQELPVSVAFHSSLIDPIAEEFNRYLSSVRYREPTLPIISCLCADVISKISTDHLWKVFREPILFRETIRNLESDTYFKRSGCTYIDLSPSSTLSTLLKYVLPDRSRSDVHSVMSPFGSDLHKLNKVLLVMSTQEKPNHQTGAKKMKAYVFPGQGSQKVGMGEGLFDEFSEVTAKADTILGYSIKDLCLRDPKKQLGLTIYTQPALYVVNSLTYMKLLQTEYSKPDYVAGHSLGEYSALFAADAFTFEMGLRLVKKRGELMSGVAGGAMAAIIGLKDDSINQILKDNELNSITIANYNSLSQIVISGFKEDIAKAQGIFEKVGAVYIRLNVSGAFHSAHMIAVRDEFEKFLSSIVFSELSIPVISNVYARPYKKTDVTKTLLEQITSPVKWTETIRYLMGKGTADFKEIGPGTALTELIKTIKDSTPPIVSCETEEPSIRENQDDGINVRTDVGLRSTTSSSISVYSAAPCDRGDKHEDASITAESLGSKEFKKDYNLRYAYVTGAMYRAIASKEMVVKVGKAGMMGYFGTGGLDLDVIESSIRYIQNELANGEAYGMNLLNSSVEESTIDLYLKYGIKNIEASAYIDVTPALVRYRTKGLKRDHSDRIVSEHRIMAKVSRPEVAEAFLSPAPERIVHNLLKDKLITPEQAELSRQTAMADDICAEADSGGHTDARSPYSLTPTIIKVRDDITSKYQYKKKIRVGAAGGIGTPEAAAAAFVLGADFILTGSINQCTVEAGTSELVKDMLQDINVQDTAYAPSGDMFESGARVQVLRKGVFFPFRANKLYELYQRYNSIDEIGEQTKRQLEEKYFRRSFEDILREIKRFYSSQNGGKAKMSTIFKWYFYNATELALKGDLEHKVDFQVMCGPALGAFNQWVKGTKLESWQNRHVDEIGINIMNEAASVLNKRLLAISVNNAGRRATKMVCENI